MMKSVLFTGFIYFLFATIVSTPILSSSELLFAEITSFTATYDEQTGEISIDWSVWNENNVKTYELKKAFENPADFNVIYNMDSSGNKTEEVSYQLTDEVDKSGIYYYRLNTWYNDNSIEFSKIISVKIETKVDRTAVNIYPNPARDMIYVDIFNSEQGEPRITVFDVLGKEIAIKKESIKSENQILTSIPLYAMKTGTYIVRIEMNGLLYLDKVSVLQ